jgi:alpha-amylase/alpha-mannosidase (GH57 family)
MTRRALCIHGHFYQPSREDPLTGVIPQENGAEPYHNWNERINAACYLPNAKLGNFAKISFNLGPTLSGWMEKNASETLDLISNDEKKNFIQWQTGNAMAQPYHHTILPLASRQDKETQIRWGILDYIHTFGHQPEGMWLPETAVDLETLSLMAENGILFTILAPWQAAEPVDVTQPYRVELPGGRSISVFFYQSELSTCISFNPNSTINADGFIQNHLKYSFSNKEEDQMILLASDGELYGHHLAFRDKFLSYMLNGALHQAEIEYTYPGRWLREHPPVRTVEIRERTSWSCMEGVSRWCEECGCTENGSWKRPLRNLMDKVAGLVDEQYEQMGRVWLHDPWTARNDYGRVLIQDQSFTDWKAEHCKCELNKDETQRLEQLMRAQVERQRMYTSCGWFFEDFDRIEPRNNVRYAAHALVLTQIASGQELISQVADVLKPVYSLKTTANAEDVFNQAIRRFKESA